MTQNYGTPLDPAKAPPPPAPPVVPSPRAGAPAPAYPAPSEQQKTFVTVSLDASRPPSNLPPGVMPRVVNWSVRPEGLVPRSGLRVQGVVSGMSSSQSIIGMDASGLGYLHAFEDVELGVAGSSSISLGATVVAWSHATAAYWTGSHWSAITSQFTSMDGLTLPTDSVTIYNPDADVNAVVWVTGSGTLPTKCRPLIWNGPNHSTATYYSFLTNSGAVASLLSAPRAVGYFDTRLVFANIFSGNTRIPQRIVWSERGSIQTFVEPTGGTEDLVSMRGGIVRIVDDGDRMVLVGEEEIWAAYKANFPFDFQFVPLDRTMGTGDARTVVRTPIGIMFQGYDYNVHVLPRGASQTHPVGAAVWPQIRAQQNAGLSRASYSFAVYDALRAEYVLYPMTLRGSSGNPWLGFAYNIQTQTWSTRSFVPQLAHGVLVTRDAELAAPVPPNVCYLTSGGTVVREYEQTINVPSYSSANTLDISSAFSASAMLPIGNPNPQRKLYVRDLLIDYSNASCPSGSSISIGLSSDFGQTIDRTIGVALPFTTISRQTVVNVGYSAIYPSIDVQYQSQVSGHFLRIQKLTALVEDIGQPGVGSA